jgi:hypothetical protein
LSQSTALTIDETETRQQESQEWQKSPAKRHLIQDGIHALGFELSKDVVFSLLFVADEESDEES